VIEFQETPEEILFARVTIAVHATSQTVKYEFIACQTVG